MQAIQRLFSVSVRAEAVLTLLATLALPAGAAIVTLGEVNPNPSGGTFVGRLSIGQGGSGSVTVNAASTLSGDVIGLGEQPTGNGSLTVTGAGSAVNLLPTGTTGNLNIGSLGTGSVSVLDGASFAYGVAGTGCAVNCQLSVSSGAGSDGNLLVSGAGTSFSTPGIIYVGVAAVSTVATDGFDYGTAGGVSHGSARIEAGGSLSASRMVIATTTGNGRNGTEQSFGSVTVDGVGSLVTLSRGATQTGDLAPLALGTGSNSQGTLVIQNGGRVRIDGSAANPVAFSGANIGSGGATASGLLRVDGAGSRLEVAGPLGFINVGTNIAGSSGELRVTNGGLVTGIGDGGLPFISVGRNGASGLLNVSGNDAAGNASTVRLAGRNPQNGGGAFLNIGGTFNTTGASNGTVNVTAGGRLEIDTANLVLTNPNGQTGMYVGIGAGATGAMNISGKSALTGAASTVAITAGTGLAPFVGIGRDGATGTLGITGGGKLLIDSSHVSVPNPGTYLQGDSMSLNIGQRVAAGADPSTGTVTVSGTGSELAMTGSVDRLIQLGLGSNSSGTLNILSGGLVRTEVILVANNSSATGLLNMNGGQLIIDGSRQGGPVAGTGGGVAVGRGGGVGTANIANGSIVNISSAAPQAFITIGGTTTAVGGTGTMNISGGSSVTVSGPSARVSVGGAGNAAQAAIGTLTLSGAGSSLTVTGSDAKVQIAATANSIGTLVVGAGSSLTSSSLIGVAHNGTADTGGIGTLVVNGSATAPNVVIGTSGLLGGSGVVNGTVTNHGVINPGNSPGTLTINGGFDNSDGKIVLEIKMLADGSFITDQLVFTDLAQVTMGAGRIEFDFLDDTDPNAFFNAGLFQLASFFKEVDAAGVLHDLPQADLGLFGQSVFDAWSDSYNFSRFSFDPFTGADFAAAAIPLPGSAALVLAGLLALVGSRHRSRVSGARAWAAPMRRTPRAPGAAAAPIAAAH